MRDSTISRFLQPASVCDMFLVSFNTSMYCGSYKIQILFVIIFILIGAIYTLAFDFFIGDGLSFASQGALMLYVDNFSEAVCIVQRGFNSWADGGSYYSYS